MKRTATRKVARRQLGGACPCSMGGLFSKGGKPQQPQPQLGGYRATAKNRKLLARLRKGESIGFTATASLKAKGLIPRTSRKNYGKKILGPKYR